MRPTLLIGILLVSVSAFGQAPTISPANPILALSGTQQFSCSAGNCTNPVYTCTNVSNGGTCFGSVTSGGLYTAPATFASRNSIGGYQLLPPDHIFNTRIDTLPLRSDSATLIAGAGTVPVNYLPSFPLNYVNNSTSTCTLHFYYTFANDGTFPCPVWPVANIEGGWFDAMLGDFGRDHHMITVNTQTGQLTERYQYYGQAPITGCTITSNVAVCTITPSPTSPAFSLFNAGGLFIQIGSFTGGDTYLNGGFTLTSGTTTTITFPITHANATTSTTGNVSFQGATPAKPCVTAGNCVSNSGLSYNYSDYALPTNASTDAAGMFLEPLTLHNQEIVQACANGTAIQHALRMSLNPGFIGLNTFVWPATAGASDGGIIPLGVRFRLKAAFAIGGFSSCAQVLLTQMKNYGLILADGGTSWQIQVENGNLPKVAADTILEINNANIATSNWEVVDESSLMETSSSGAANNGEIITLTTNGGTATTHIDLQGSAMNVGTNMWYTVGGGPQLQLPVNSNGTFTCAMSPTVGSLTSGGLYTPPASVAIGTISQTTVTCTSSVTAAVKNQILVTVFPAMNMNIIQDDSDFTDSHGVKWFAGTKYGFGMANIPQIEGCCQHDGSFLNIIDKQLFWNELSSSYTNTTDYKVDLHVPAGAYQIIFNNGTFNIAAGVYTRYFYGNGTSLGTIDASAVAGGAHKPYTLTATVMVGSDNLLSFYNTGVGLSSGGSGRISSISFALIASQPGTTAPPRPGVIVGYAHRRGWDAGSRHGNYAFMGHIQ